MRIQLFPFDHVFRKGSSIRLWIDAPTGETGGWSFDFLKTPAVNSIYADPRHPSALVLGQLLGGRAQAPRPRCGTVLNEPCRRNAVPAPSGTMTIPDRGRSARLRAERWARISASGANATVSMSCAGAGRCAGRARLTARVHRPRAAAHAGAAAHGDRRRKRRVVLGHCRYAIDAGEGTKARMRVARRYRTLLRRHELRHATLSAGGEKTRVRIVVRGHGKHGGRGAV